MYRSHFGLRDISEASSAKSIRKWITMFKATGPTVRIINEGRPKSVRTPEVIDSVMKSVRQNPQQSTRKRSQVLGINRSILRRILHRDLHLKAYKIQLTQELKPNDPNLRLELADVMLNRFDNFFNIMFSDEANFHVNGQVNKQNCRFWSKTNPQLKHQNPLHSP